MEDGEKGSVRTLPCRIKQGSCGEQGQRLSTLGNVWQSSLVSAVCGVVWRGRAVLVSRGSRVVESLGKDRRGRTGRGSQGAFVQGKSGQVSLWLGMVWQLWCVQARSVGFRNGLLWNGSLG